jgi:hypothetical protein
MGALAEEQERSPLQVVKKCVVCFGGGQKFVLLPGVRRSAALGCTTERRDGRDPGEHASAGDHERRLRRAPTHGKAACGRKQLAFFMAFLSLLPKFGLRYWLLIRRKTLLQDRIL